MKIKTIAMALATLISGSAFAQAAVPAPQPPAPAVVGRVITESAAPAHKAQAATPQKASSKKHGKVAKKASTKKGAKKKLAKKHKTPGTQAAAHKGVKLKASKAHAPVH